MKKVNLVICQILFLFTAVDVYANAIVSCQQILESDKPNSELLDPWEILRVFNTLVNQQSMPGWDYLCAPSCAINLIQATAVLRGLGPILNAQVKFEEFVLENMSPEEGLNLADTVSAIKTFADISNISRPRVEGLLLDGIDHKDAPEIVSVKELNESSLKPSLGNLKFISALMLDLNGEPRSGHALIVHSIVGGVIKVIDMNAPQKNLRLVRVSERIINGIKVPQFEFIGDERLAGVSGFVPLGVLTISAF